MKYNPQEHHRRSIRLQGHDYAQPGAYFVTIVTHNHACLFGEIIDGEVRLSSAGQIAQNEWQLLEQRFPNIQLEVFIVMPNHVHGVIIINAGVGATHPIQTGHTAGKDIVPGVSLSGVDGRSIAWAHSNSSPFESNSPTVG